jgi:hypothetical protein
MFETVTLEQLRRMLPGAAAEDLARVLELCQSSEGDAALRDLVGSCDCLAGAVCCTCRESDRPGSSLLLETLAAVYRAGAGKG